MRILRVIPSIDPRHGGPAEAARRFDTELLKLGHSVEVVALDAALPQGASDYPAPVHVLGHKREGYRFSDALVPWLRSNAPRFDAALVDGLWQYPGFGTWRALAGSSLPYFVFTHGMLDPWFKRQYPLKHLKKWLYWPWAEYRVLRDARAVLFTCEEERRLARESFWLYRAREAVTAFGTSDVPPPDTISTAGLLARHPELRGKRIALFLGRIQEKKGGDLLIEAFAAVAQRDPRLHLVMAGPEDPGWAPSLHTLAERLGIAGRITWTGMLSGEDKWAAFYLSEVFCLPSHQENFGIAVAEAMACARPVLISRQVNIWREIDQDGAGWVDEDTVAGATRLLSQWLDATPAEVARRGQAARQSFLARFQVASATRSLVQIIRSRLDGTPDTHPAPADRPA